MMRAWCGQWQGGLQVRGWTAKVAEDLRSIDDGWAGRTLYYWSQQREVEERRTVLCSIPSDERQLPYGSTAALCSSPKHIRIFMLGWFPTRFFGEVGGVYLCRFVTLRNTCKL